jgi:hypothetical protein
VSHQFAASHSRRVYFCAEVIEHGFEFLPEGSGRYIFPFSTKLDQI